MKFSEAMRLGALLKPQAFDQTYDGRGTCARGAAMDALGLLTITHKHPQMEDGEVLPFATKINYSKLLEDFPWLDKDACGCPVATCHPHSLWHDTSCFPSIYSTIAHLNDYHRWTREQIADWLEPIEDAHTVAAEAVVEQELVTA